LKLVRITARGLCKLQRGVLTALNPLSNHVTFIAIVPWAYPGKAKCGKKTLIHFTRTVENQSLATDISQKWLGRTQGRPKRAKNVLKWRTFELLKN